ncbi:hypothetical protein J7643_19635 [bacterium]|nr:hypothetical protein [bacterium]
MQEVTVPQTTSQMIDDDEIDLVELALTVWKRRKIVAAITLAGTLLATGFSFTQPNIYTATATLLPTDSSSDRISNALTSLGALGGLAAQASGGLKGTVSDKFVAIIQSRRLTEQVIHHPQTLPQLFPKQWNTVQKRWEKVPTLLEAHRLLAKTISTKVDPKTGLLQLSVDHTDPKFAADLANSYVIELNAFLQGNTLSSAKRNRAFLEQQVTGVVRDLSKLEDELKKFQQAHKIVSLDAQTEAGVQTYATLKSQLMAKEMEYNLLANSVSSSDTQSIGLRQEISQIKEKLNTIENGTGDGIISFKDAPDLGVRFARIKRDLLTKQKVFELMSQQLEIAKLDEAKDTLSFQIIDEAITPDKKSKPKRGVIIAIGLIISLFIAILSVLILNKFGKWAATEPK